MRITIRLLVIISVLMVILSAVSWAGEKEELAWKGRALVAEFQMKQDSFRQAQADLQAFLKELDSKGLTYKDGRIIEKPKPPEKKAEPKEKESQNAK